MKVVKEGNIQVNHIMLKHLEDFKEKCAKIVNSVGTTLIFYLLTLSLT